MKMFKGAAAKSTKAKPTKSDMPADMPTTTDNDEAARAGLTNAELAFKAGDTAGAIEIVRTLTTSQQTYFRPFYNLGYYLNIQGDHAGALVALDGALTRLPKYADAYFVKGRSFTALGRHLEAFEAYKAACAIAPDQIWYRRGYIASLATLRKEVVDLGYGAIFEAEMKDRAATKRAMPSTQLAIRHTGNCKVVPTRELMLDLLPKNGIVAEVGVAFGDCICSICGWASATRAAWMR
jgi:tetratricopeptide (TPR) repeat protein